MIYITGDVHGNIDFFKNPKLKKLKKDDILIIVGDFGFIWSGDEEEKKNLEILKNKKYTICFVDGCHENFDVLNSFEPYRFKGGNAHKIARNIYQLLRGEIFTFEKKTFFVMGGGESLDADLRKEGETWWSDELPNNEELLNGANNLKEYDYKVDYILTHEAPAVAKDFIRLHSDHELNVTTLNTYLEELMKNTEYNHWYFSSLHIDCPISKKMTAIYDEIIKID